MNQQHRPVPGIARGPQQNFAQSSARPIPHPMMGQPPAFQAPAVEGSTEDDLAMEIYCRLAVDHIRFKEGGYHRQTLAGIAKSAKVAAQVYFSTDSISAETQP